MWYGIALFIGLVLLTIGIYRFNKSISFLKAGQRVQAVVAEVESYRSDGSILYRPIFQYTVGQQTLKYTYKVGSNPAGWKVGQETWLMIAPDNPEKVMLVTYFGAFNWSIILIAIALPMIFIGAGYFWATNYLQKLTSF
jgi:hypothetical protein